LRIDAPCFAPVPAQPVTAFLAPGDCWGLAQCAARAVAWNEEVWRGVHWLLLLVSVRGRGSGAGAKEAAGGRVYVAAGAVS
jgi:hypothetical protein